MRDSNGFTLIEILIAIGVFSLVGALISQVFFTTLRVNTKTELIKSVKQNGESAIGIIGRLIRNSSSINVPCQSADTYAPWIAITSPDQGISYITCAEDGSVARIASGSAGKDNVYLTDRTATLSSKNDGKCATSTLKFSCPTTPGTSSPITITFSLSQGDVSTNSANSVQMSFQSTVAPRN